MSWLTDTLIVTGALIAMVLLLRGPIARAFGPGAAYALWALPLLRLLLPPLTLPAAAPAIPGNTVSDVVTVLTDPVPVSAVTAPVWDLAPLLQTIWLLGALAYLVWRGRGYAEMRRRLLSGAVNVGETEGVRLIESTSAATPVAFGVLDKVIALPPGFMALTPLAERDLAIAHELEHHRGRDLAINIAVQPLLALHWFNPLAWIGWRALRRDQEAACDARVLAGREAETRAIYGRLIASFAVNPSPALASPLACPILHEKSIIYRLRSLTMTEPTKTRRLAGRLLIGAAALALPLTATITYAAGEDPAPATSGKSDAKVTHGIVIIDVPEGASPDDKDLHVRTVVRNGKTIVLKTKQPLSDAEAEARIAKAEAEMPEMPEMPEPPAPPMPPEGGRQVVIVKHGDHAAHGKGEKREVHTMVFRHGGDGAAMPMAHGEGGMAMAHCTEGKPVVARVDKTSEGKQHHSVVMVCAKPGDKGASLAGLRSARERVAADKNMPADVKADVLKQLDGEIEKAAKAE